ncbi:MAG: helix-turn-helix domain-containing protein [Clostridiales bacterium]|nr:helix-turn-helix domain-containing protein [Clostridiales bacterium]
MEVIDYEALGRKIKNARESLKITQEHLAEVVGLSSTHISNIETAHTRVSLPALVMIANELKVSMDELLTDSLTYSNKQYKVGQVVDIGEYRKEELVVMEEMFELLHSFLKKNKKNK